MTDENDVKPLRAHVWETVRDFNQEAGCGLTLQEMDDLTERLVYRLAIPPTEKDQKCRNCTFGRLACIASRDKGYIKCCPDCDHRPVERCAGDREQQHRCQFTAAEECACTDPFCRPCREQAGLRSIYDENERILAALKARQGRVVPPGGGSDD